jgi:DNA-directed RNA polymerase specialized sigma24 family protein
MNISRRRKRGQAVTARGDDGTADLATLRELSTTVEEARRALDEATARRDLVVRELRRQGLHLNDIAEAAGLTIGRVSQIDGKNNHDR